MFLMQYFCLRGILPFSKSYPETESTWPTAKCRGRMYFDTWYCTVICATLDIKIGSTYIFWNWKHIPKDILKSKVRDQSIKATKKLFYHVIIKNYLYNVSWRFLIKTNARRGVKSKNRHPSWLYCTVIGPSEAATGGGVFCNIYRKHPCWSLYFKTLQTLRPATLLKRDPNTGVFLTSLKNICKRQLFSFFNGSLLHGAKGLRSTLYDGVRLQGPSHSSSFFFKSASLVLKEIPNHIRKPKTNIIISLSCHEQVCLSEIHV